MSADPTTWGPQTNGWVTPSAAEILEAVETDQLALISPNLDIDPDSPTGQTNGIFVAQLARVWEALGALEASRTRDGAEGAMLDELGKLTGTSRDEARATTVSCNCTLTSGTTITTEHLASIAGRPEITFAPIADFTAPSTGTHAVMFECTEIGPVVVSPATLTVISTPVSGWTAVTNPSAGITGSEVATDADTRIEQERDLAAAGSATSIAIASDIVYDDADGTGVAGVLYCRVLENDTDTTDGDGLPPHSIEVVVHTDGTESASALREAIWKAKPAGCYTHGTTSGTYVDENGDSHTVRYSGVSDVDIYATYTVSVGTDFAGDAALKQAIVDAMTARCGISDDVNYVYMQALPLTQVGVTDVTAFAVGTAPAPTGHVNIAIGLRQRARFTTANISVTHA
jgi:hypothetical protein